MGPVVVSALKFGAMEPSRRLEEREGQHARKVKQKAKGGNDRDCACVLEQQNTVDDA